jgi:hypothetical protein
VENAGEGTGWKIRETNRNRKNIERERGGKMAIWREELKIVKRGSI